MEVKLGRTKFPFLGFQQIGSLDARMVGDDHCLEELRVLVAVLYHFRFVLSHSKRRANPQSTLPVCALDVLVIGFREDRTGLVSLEHRHECFLSPLRCLLYDLVEETGGAGYSERMNY
jgi:hypothetical protein